MNKDVCAELLEALERVVARMDENPPEKKADLDSALKRAAYYRDLDAARKTIEKAKE